MLRTWPTKLFALCHSNIFDAIFWVFVCFINVCQQYFFQHTGLPSSTVSVSILCPVFQSLVFLFERVQIQLNFLFLIHSYFSCKFFVCFLIFTLPKIFFLSFFVSSFSFYFFFQLLFFVLFLPYAFL